MLYPIMTQSRQLISLDGIWNFIYDGVQLDESKAIGKFKNPISMPVPCSYNDIKEGINFRDHVGWVWYQRDLYITESLLKERLVLRFGSATHSAKLYINEKFVLEHKGGFLPFEIELNDIITSGINDVKIAVNNIVDFSTLPIGNFIETEINGKKMYKNTPMFDFFNYAGIQRPVNLYTTPHSYIEDVTITTDIINSTGFVNYSVDFIGNLDCTVKLIDEDGVIVAHGLGTNGKLKVKNANLWKPLNAYLYELQIEGRFEGKLVDQYLLPVGIRTVKVEGHNFLINNEPFYFKGFGKHEDSHIHGRGFDEALNVKDIGLLKWLNANSFRTSHYPYSEEMMRLCAREGIVVIDETPAVGLAIEKTTFFGQINNTNDVVKKTWETVTTFEHHKEVLNKLINRDKNNPAVCMWSIANEADTMKEGAQQYFKPLIDLTRKLDPQQRPVTIALVMEALPHNDLVSEYIDVISLNRYYGWYTLSGDLDMAEQSLREELREWTKFHPDKPILFTEYGADTIAGFHDTTSAMFTEEYQVDFYNTYHRIFDEFDNVIGEHAWNFSDFATSQELIGFLRVQGNKKGIFTRDRKPKMAAHMFKNRWNKIPEFGYKKDK